MLRQITLVSIICLLILSAASCASNQTNISELQATQTPSGAVNSSEVEATSIPNSTNNKLPVTVKSAVLSDAAKRVSKPVAALRITQAEEQSWGDSCLGLAQTGKVCAQVIVPGWKVVVNDGLRDLVYRTDNKGKQIKLEDL
ncbi:MAG: hypothetical protein KI793_26730 [Rivularia sp. (in: Bacteria)]|nr:hypothetical protein [Rivularia sp. MS3]